MSKTLSANVTAGVSGDSQPVYLIKITMLDSNLHYWAYPNSHTDVEPTPDDYYDGDKISKMGNIRYSIRLENGGNVASVSTFTFEVANPWEGDQLYSDVIFAEPNIYENATIEIRLIFADKTNPYWSNAVPLFNGFIETVTWDWNALTFKCVDSWHRKHRKIPEGRFRKTDVGGAYEYMPEEVDSKTVPILYGHFSIGPLHKTGVCCEHSAWGTYKGHMDYIKGFLIKNKRYNDLVYIFAHHTLTWVSNPPWGGTNRMVAGYSGDCPGKFAVSNITEGTEDSNYQSDGYYARKDCSIHDRAPSIRRIAPIELTINPSMDGINCVNEDPTDETTIKHLSGYTYHNYAVPIHWLADLEGNKAWRIRGVLKLTNPGSYVDEAIRVTVTMFANDGTNLARYRTGFAGRPDLIHPTHTTEATIDFLILGAGGAGWKIDDDAAYIRIDIDYRANNGGNAIFHLRQLHMQMSDQAYTSAKPKLPEAPKEIYATADGRLYPSDPGSWVNGSRSHPDSPDDIIQNPSGIIESILRDVLDLGDSDVDEDAFDEVATILDYSGTRPHIMARQILDAENSLDVIKKLCYEAGIAYCQNWEGKEALFPLIASTDSEWYDSTPIDNTTILTQRGRYIFKVDKTPMSALKANFYLHYKRNVVSDKFEETMYVNNADQSSFQAEYSNMPNSASAYWTKCHALNTDYGINDIWEYEAEWIRDEDAAERFLMFIIDWLIHRHYIVEFTSALDHVDLELGDQRKIDHAVLPTGINNSEHFLLVHQEFRPKTNSIRMRWLCNQWP